MLEVVDQNSIYFSRKARFTVKGCLDTMQKRILALYI